MLYNIRALKREDAIVLHHAFKKDGITKEERQFLAYYSEQQKGERKVFIAEYEGIILGYATVHIRPKKGPLKGKIVPELSDLHVFECFRNQNISKKLIKCCENEAIKINDFIYLPMPLEKSFSHAHKMFATQGYIPDGSGIWYNGEPLENSENINDSTKLILYMYKQLKVLQNTEHLLYPL